MSQSFWGIFVFTFGIIVITILVLFQSLTNTEEHNYTLLKETTEAAMYDALDKETTYGNEKAKIDEKKFITSFTKRFADNAQLSRTYRIEIYNINEEPPEVSLKVYSKSDSDKYTTRKGEVINFTLTDKIDAILEQTNE